MHWSADYIGIPFEWNGYSKVGASCWGLAWLVQRDVFGRLMPKHNEAEYLVAQGDAADPGIWHSGINTRPIAISEAKEGDILHMWGVHGGKRTPLHVGVFTSAVTVLHTEQGTGSIVENIASRRAAWRPIQAHSFV